MTERLSKFLSRSGIASRRGSASILDSGRIKVNGTPVSDPSRPVDPATDVITLDDVAVKPPTRLVYIALYKPPGYLSDLSDPRGRKIARDLIDLQVPLFPVGRLDYNSEGLILFTNDGALANFVMHPRYGVEKEYLAKLKGKITTEDKKRMLAGIRIDREVYKAKTIGLVKETRANGWYRIIVSEGKNRMIRKMAAAVRHPVIKLKRIRIDGLKIEDLLPGQYRHFDPTVLLPASQPRRGEAI